MPIGVVAELEMAEEEAVDALRRGDGRPRVDEDEVFVLSLAGPDDEVGLEDEEGAMGCAIGTVGTIRPSARDGCESLTCRVRIPAIQYSERSLKIYHL